MKDFEYLNSIVTPTKTQWIVSILIGILVAIVQIVFYTIHDINDLNNNRYHRRLYKTRY